MEFNPRIESEDRAALRVIPYGDGEGKQREGGRQARGKITEKTFPEGDADNKIERDGGPGDELKNLERITERATGNRSPADTESDQLGKVATGDKEVSGAAGRATMTQERDGPLNKASEVKAGGDPQPSTISKFGPHHSLKVRGPMDGASLPMSGLASEIGVWLRVRRLWSFKNMVAFRRSSAVWLGLVLLVGLARARDYRVNLAAVDVDRAGQLITFTWPAEQPEPAALRGEDGLVLALQAAATGRWAFVLPFQKAGEVRSFSVVTKVGKAPVVPVVVAQADAQRVRLSVGGRPVFDYPIDRTVLPRAGIKPEYHRAGYIHPVYSPSGKMVTDDYPSNHVHHHGIWSPWTKTSFQGRSPDFWNMGTKTGTEDLVALERTWGGAVHGGLEAKLQMVDLSGASPVVALHELWRVVAYDVVAVAAIGPVAVFDLEITQRCATNDPLVLPTYHYGGFGFRGAAAWNGPGDAARYLTSEGVTDRLAGNNTRGRWCYLGGLLDGKMAGTAILGHPENFRAPQPMRLHPDMPYMSYVPQQLGEFAIRPGVPYVARFRFVVADGVPDRAMIDAFWNGYARVPAVSVVAMP